MTFDSATTATATIAIPPPTTKETQRSLAFLGSSIDHLLRNVYFPSVQGLSGFFLLPFCRFLLCIFPLFVHTLRYHVSTCGGILMGYWSSYTECFITEMIGPGPKARHGRAKFEPDYGFHEKEVASVYESSGRCYAYLGDWHTYPDGGDKLSVKDRATLEQIAHSQAARCANPLMLLAAGKSEWYLRLWQWGGGSRQLDREVLLEIARSYRESPRADDRLLDD
jgi:integrative and conjugative element protein (TIGR02256 family)